MGVAPFVRAGCAGVPAQINMAAAAAIPLSVSTGGPVRSVGIFVMVRGENAHSYALHTGTAQNTRARFLTGGGDSPGKGWLPQRPTGLAGW